MLREVFHASIYTDSQQPSALFSRDRCITEFPSSL
jgi:hypothetical protein